MPVFHCGRFPDGEVPIRTVAGIVHFKDGSATVDDPELCQALREVPAVFEITEDVAGGGNHGAATPTPEQTAQVPAGQPPQSATKAVWVDWAVANGMDREAAADLTKAQLIELANRLEEE